MVEDVRTFFAKEGPIAGAFGDGYEPRSQQVEMAEAVARAMAEKTHLLAEAGTGVGKSFAYLVPAMLRCLRGETVLIATNTIALQEQLILKDVPLLVELMEKAFPRAGEEQSQRTERVMGSPERALAQEATPTPNPLPRGGGSRIKPVLVKGRGNYVSIRRLRQASERQDKLFADAAARRSLHVIEDWARETLDGTISTLPALEKMGVWDKVQSDSGNCMGRKCPTFDRCFYQGARAQLDGANLLICNHALFFSDLALRTQDVGFLPRYQHVVLDEAHNVEDVASEHFGRSLAEGRVMHLLTTLCHPRSGKGYLPNLLLHATHADAVDRAMQLAIRAQDVCRGFFENVLRATKSSGEQSGFGGGGVGNSGGRIRRSGAIDNDLSGACTELAQRLNSLKELVKNDADRFELNGYAERARMIADDANVLVDQSQPGCAYWVEATGDEDWGGGGYQKVTLACAPVEVGPLLKERLFSSDFSVVMTSATLATKTVAAAKAAGLAGGTKVEERRFVPDDEVTPVVEVAPRFVQKQDAFAHAMKRLGAEGARTMQVGSPFDYAKQVELMVDLTPPPQQENDEFASYGGERKRTWADDAAHVANRVMHHVKETDGGAFVLFTSLATLRAVAKLIREPLGMLGHPVMAQTVDGSRTAMLEQFRKDERSVLLGAASFWQGVDVRGRGLRNVIITKLPFDPPDRPLTQARHELIESRGGSSFGEDSLPRAIIRFKQGFGRLIRSAEDRGRVVVLDPRLVRSGYGKQFLASLPPGVRLTTLQ
ncbi:MAG: ATP-dependent DNA helicase [Phycisphaerales bacterium]